MSELFYTIFHADRCELILNMKFNRQVHQTLLFIWWILLESIFLQPVHSNVVMNRSVLSVQIYCQYWNIQKLLLEHNVLHKYKQIQKGNCCQIRLHWIKPLKSPTFLKNSYVFRKVLTTFLASLGLLKSNVVAMKSSLSRGCLQLRKAEIVKVC